MNRVRATLSTMNLPFDEYWAYCLLDTVIKTNAVLHTPSNSIPLRLWNENRHERSTLPRRSHDLIQYRVFRELAMVPVRKAIQSKSDPRARRVRYLFSSSCGYY